MFGAGIAAARDGRAAGWRTSPVLGVVGLSLVGAGTAAIVVAAPGQQDYDVALMATGIGMAVAGTGLGVAQDPRLRSSARTSDSSCVCRVLPPVRGPAATFPSTVRDLAKAAHLQRAGDGLPGDLERSQKV